MDYEATSPSHARRAPPGIFFGWYIVAATIVLYILAAGVIYYGFAVFFNAILGEYPWSKAATAAAFGMMQLEGYSLSPFWGLLVSRFGTRGPMLVGTVLLAMGCFVLSKLDSLLVFFLGFFIAGLGFGAYLTAPLAAIGNWFRARRTLAIGLALSGFGLSGFLAPVLDWGIQGYGWRAVYVAAGAAAIVLGIPLCLLLRYRPEPYGHAVDGKSTPVDGDARGPRTDAESAGRPLTAREALRTRAFWLITVLFAFSFLAMTGIYPHMVTYLTGTGIEPGLAVLGITGLTVASAVGMIGGGALGDQRGNRHVLIGALLVHAVGILIFATVSQPWQLLVFVVMAGSTAGAFNSIVPALIAEYFGTRSFAQILGLVYAPAPFIWFGIPSSAGWVADHFGTYRPAWLALAALILAAVPLALMLRPPAPPTS